MEFIKNLATYAGYASSIFACALIFIRPFREWLFGISSIRDGQKCLLRSEMLHIYYEYKDGKRIRQYEYENFMYLYKAYKALKGNSFIDKIHEEVSRWEVIT